MPRITNVLLLCVSCLPLGLGCAHFVETQAIQQFAAALENEDLPTLRDTSSNHFRQKALRLTQSLDDFKILNLPKGEVSIVSVEDVSPDKKRVTVEVGERKQKVLYELLQSREGEEWFVDDVYIKQKRKGMTAAKSVTEQMDLLLTVREFLAAWNGGARDDVLKVTTPELGELLGGLPPAYLARLTKQIVGEAKHGTRLRPEAQMDEEIAMVRLPRVAADLILSMKLLNDQWKVSDVAVNSRSDADVIPSVRKLAAAARATAAFFEAYAESDKQALQALCTQSFYRSSLAAANLAMVPLPAPDWLSDDDRFTMHGMHTDFITNGDSEMLKISLIHEDPEDPEALPAYRIEEVTIYELSGQRQEMRLTALFTAQAVAQIFSDALAARDLKHLRQSSAPEFRTQVWDRLNDATIHELPLSAVADTTSEVISTRFRGAVTEVSLRQGLHTVTYFLRDYSGRLLVDDIRVLCPGCPESLKTTFSVIIPINEFAAGIRQANVEVLQRVSSEDLNRLVWHQSKQVPELAFPVAGQLQMALVSVDLTDGHATAKFGDSHCTAQVFLVQERGRYVVDDVVMSNPQTQEQASLKHELRTQMADRRLTQLTNAAVAPQDVSASAESLPAKADAFPPIQVPPQSEPQPTP